MVTRTLASWGGRSDKMKNVSRDVCALCGQFCVEVEGALSACSEHPLIGRVHFFKKNPKYFKIAK